MFIDEGNLRSFSDAEHNCDQPVASAGSCNKQKSGPSSQGCGRSYGDNTGLRSEEKVSSCKFMIGYSESQCRSARGPPVYSVPPDIAH